MSVFNQVCVCAIRCVIGLISVFFIKRDTLLFFVTCVFGGGVCFVV